MLPSSASGLLKGQEFVRQWIEGERLGIQDRRLRLDLLEHAVDELGEHAGHRLQAARKEAHLFALRTGAIEVQLDAHPIELELDVRLAAEFFQKARDVG